MRGLEKKIIYVKDTGSRFFEEAYFVLRRGSGTEGGSLSEGDMVREAERIVAQSGNLYTRRRRSIGTWFAFLCGAASAAILIGCSCAFPMLF